MTPIPNPEQLLGTVVAVQANFYQVRLHTPPISSLLLCTRRNLLKKTGQKIMVGDRVVIAEPDFTSQTGAISAILPRQTQLQRPPIANAQQILLLFAIAEPNLEPWQLSRFLISAESNQLQLSLALNKIDLVTPTQQQQWQQRLQSWGYQPLLISVENNQGLDQLLATLENKITILTGLSGVGKSSLINKIVPEVNLRVREVSGKLRHGVHTTRHVELFELPNHGFLADSPGFNQPNLEIEPHHLAFYFPEAKQRLLHGKCQFNDCFHRDEPNCVVRGDWERYEHYLKFLAEAIAFSQSLQNSSDPESNWKIKMKQGGLTQYEPKLQSKKYRRLSRRQKQQNLLQVYQEQEDDV